MLVVCTIFVLGYCYELFWWFVCFIVAVDGYLFEFREPLLHLLCWLVWGFCAGLIWAGLGYLIWALWDWLFRVFDLGLRA